MDSIMRRTAIHQLHHIACRPFSGRSENYSNCQWQKVSTAISKWSNCKRYESTAHAELQYYQSFELTRGIDWPHKSNCRHTCGRTEYRKDYLRFIWGSGARMVGLMSERVKRVWKIVSPRCLVYTTWFAQHLALQATCEKLQTKINTQDGGRKKNESENVGRSISLFLGMLSTFEYMMSITIKIILCERRTIL